MSLRKLVPSPNALFLFEAAARHLNFTHAGQEFNITQSAVSRMMGRLESHLGVRLFNRLSHGLSLTDEGRLLALAVAEGFDRVASVLEEISAKDGGEGLVSVSVSAAFAMYWFLPRLDGFREQFPGIDLRFQLVHGEPVGPCEDVDLAIRFDQPPAVNQQSWKLTDEIVVPVCSPSYLAVHGPLDPAGDNADHVFVHLSGRIRIPWSRYLSETGYPPAPEARGMVFADYALAVQAAIKGRGVALGWWHVVANELLQEALVPASPHELITGQAYYLVATQARPLRRPALLLRDWLLEETAMLRARLANNNTGGSR